MPFGGALASRSSVKSHYPNKSVAAVLFAAASLFAAEPGTIGVAVNQLYSEQQPSKRGVFMVRKVAPSSSAAEAGIEAGDLIIATDSKPVAGIELKEMVRSRLGGDVGSSIQLSVVKTDDKFQKIMLVRRPFPPHVNPASDPFSYVVPGNWEMDPRYPFPLPWSPSIAHTGFEDLAFAPGFDDQDSPEYHSYLIVWWLDGRPEISAASLQSDMLVYFRGLSDQRGHNNNFKPDSSRVTAQYEAVANESAAFGGAPAQKFAGLLTLYDRHGNVIQLQSEVTASSCDSGHTAVFFEMSKEPRPAPLWTQLDQVRDKFQCHR
jgi:membrane-associated protease RseP (regulator of RpoE activity)